MADYRKNLPDRRATGLKGRHMPYVNIKITNENVTSQRKADLISGVTTLLQDVLDKDPNTTFVVIDEVSLEDWGIGGLPVAKYRRRKAS